jgi:hypothetical protein
MSYFMNSFWGRTTTKSRFKRNEDWRMTRQYFWKNDSEGREGSGRWMQMSFV